VAGLLLAALAAATGPGCGPADAPPAPPAGPPLGHPGPSVAIPGTIGLWHMDETSQVALADSGPHGLTAYVGRDARPEFGRFRSGRRFTRSLESFAYVPYAPALDSPREFAVEAWVQPTEYALYEASVIVGRWTRNANQQSWLLGLAGERRSVPSVTRPSPGTLADLVGARPSGTLFFALQPVEAGPSRAYFTTERIPLGEWTHVAATYDGRIVRLYVGGRLEAQFANPGGIRTTDAPVLFGNLLDPQWISSVEGSVRLEGGIDLYPYYAFTGAIDEVRILGTRPLPR
jgi:hypothetical protein